MAKKDLTINAKDFDLDNIGTTFELLDLYPEHVLMSYLRVKSNLKDQPELLKQLNLIFENNSNFVEIKI